jgi:glyoxylase-like metal-dependent hydrolase (beta-lactamase superfamily II)
MPVPNSAYRGQNTANTHLKWDEFVTPSIPVVTTDFAPGEHERPWPPISSTLVYGLRDAVVVDSFITQEQAKAQADWIASAGKNLTTIYATHGHGDHFFGARVLLERFPKARFVAAPIAVEVMKQQVSPEYVAKFWESVLRLRPVLILASRVLPSTPPLFHRAERHFLLDNLVGSPFRYLRNNSVQL